MKIVGRKHYMRYKDEDQIKQALGIESWRNLSKDKMIKFAAMMPDMDTKLALKIVEQFPHFKEFAMDAVDAMEKAHEATLKANKQSQKRVHQAFQHIREVLVVELEREGLSWEEKQYLLEKIMETGNLQFQKDTENKEFLDGLFKKVLMGAGAALALGVAFVGGRVLVDGDDSPEGGQA